MTFKSPALLLLFLICLTATILFTLRSVLFSSSVFDSGSVTLSALNEPVQLDRLENGMVRIILENTEDLETALGYVHARDRLWQLEKMHMAVNGKLSQHFGENFMRADLLTRVLLHPSGSVGDDGLAGFSDEQIQFFDRYAQGINAFIVEAGRNIPMQFTINGSVPTRWTVKDVAAAFIIQLWLLENGWQQEMVNLKVSNLIPPGLIPVLFGREAAAVFQRFEPNSSFLEQVRELLIADHQLRQLLNAPAQIEPVRSVAEIRADGSSDVLLTFQSGPQTPSFWYDTEIQSKLTEASKIHSFTLPGTPVLWAGSDDYVSWHPVHTKGFTDMLVPVPDNMVMERIALNTATGGSSLFRLIIGQETFSLLPDQRSAYLFSRPHTRPDQLLAAFPNVHRFGKDHPFDIYANHLNIIENYATEIVQNDPYIRTNGFKKGIEAGLSRQSFFEEGRILGFENPELLVTHEGRLQFAQNLSDIFAAYRSVASLSMAAEYLSNWDGQYNRYLTAATLTELSLLKTAENALASYIDEDVVDVLREINLVDPEIGVFLLQAHLAAQGSASPVSDQFFARRVQEALNELEAIFGPEPYEWRWGNVNRNTFSDAALCGNQTHTAFIRNRACSTLESISDITILGQRDLVNAAVIYIHEGNVQSRSFTSGVLQSRRAAGEQARHVSLLSPGYSENPFSRWFATGMNYWPYFEQFSLIPNTNVHSTLRVNPIEL
ncbi:Penicillin amidase [Cyclonatronum proteinivorum]|uniref:Penicillin amidase n=1 Tax=Cyclonatronum proteinivorum TaxID=1457365 RepID=A0A345ULA9_9BACT|nr:penicillin acylase family protein [Cyclonatronum proteinivorum]AXJ01261.1 Penicillin amidase [Cyclonatronum proteinivorum]